MSYTTRSSMDKVSLFLLLAFFASPSVFGQCGPWTEINPAADWSTRAGLQAVSLENTFYILGGRTPRPPTFPPIPGDSDIWNDVWSSADDGSTWTNILANDTLNGHWPARAYFQAVTKGDSIFILGGQNYNVELNPVDSSLVSTSDFFDDVWASVDGVSWTQLTDSAGWAGRAGLSAAVYNNEIYVMGGSFNDDPAVIGGPPVRVYFNDVWKSADGENWVQLTDSAAWSKRAGGIAVVKDEHLYMIGGEEGFLCLPGGPCPPYFNDVWRTQDGIDWEQVTDEAEWQSRPGHQVVVADDYFVLFGGFGLDTLNPFAPANPIDAWISADGAVWEQLVDPPWNAVAPTEIKYDFDALVKYDEADMVTYIYSFGGDRETFNFMDPVNYLNVDNDVWRFCSGGTITSISRVDANTAFHIYPNPGSGTFTLRYDGPAAKADVEVLDLTGRLVRTERVALNAGAGHAMDLSGLAKGNYLVRLTVDGLRSTQQLIVE